MLPSSCFDFDVDSEDDDSIANLLYEAQEIAADQPRQAVDICQRIVDERKDPWTMRSLFLMTCLLLQAGQRDEGLNRYEDMLRLLHTVSHNERLNRVNHILGQALHQNDPSLTIRMFELTIHAATSLNSPKIGFMTSMKLARLYASQGNYEAVSVIVKRLRPFYQENDASKASELFDLLSIEMLVSRVPQDAFRIHSLFAKAIQLAKTAIVDPRVLGFIYERHGMLSIFENNLDSAFNDFYSNDFRSFTAH